MTPHRSLQLLLLIALCSAGVSALALVPDLKPGLWETVTHDLQSGKTQRSKQCISEEVLALMRKMGDAQLKNPNRPCKILRSTRSGSTQTEETECTLNGVVMRTTSVGTMGPESVHSHTHRETAGGSMPARTQDSESDMTFLGTCPAGMEAGDVILPDGSKTNFIKMMGSPGMRNP